jgi:UDP-N-acetylmuramoyl-L-alanyl-D-glutamate--2,6-diaminopimelate ligase
MELTQLLNSVKAIQVVGEVQRKDISAIVYDSRKAIKNSVFVAVKGYKYNGHNFILDAINKGAIAVILEDNQAVPDQIFYHAKAAKILVKSSRIALAEISAAFYRRPSEKLKLIGVTGTNGKTTTTYIIKSVFETAGFKVGLLGTIANYIGEKEIKSSLTTPEASDTNELLFEMVQSGCSYAVMEVSSHSLFLNRVTNLYFSGAIFTNITSEHLDFHKNFENYLSSKRILFASLASSAFGVYNLDDPYSPHVILGSKAQLFSYGTASNADFLISDIKFDLDGTKFDITYNNKQYAVSTSLIGGFNAYNCCAAFAASVLSGVKEEKALEGIKNASQVPGRFEVISSGNKKIIIDYSHTGDSLEKTLLVIRDIVKDENPIYTVFGCGGDRDKSKRPVMGRIAASLSDKVIITSDNPRNENPFEIINEIKSGINKDNYKIIENREEAIAETINNSEENSVILIAGKGHEDYQEIAGVKYHFSDKEIVYKYLSE